MKDQHLSASEFPVLLIVGEMPAEAATLTETLESQGFVLRWVTDTGGIASVCAAQSPDLVLLWSNGQGSTQICRELKSRAPHLPIILIYESATAAERLEGLMAGADDYLFSPFLPEELLIRVRKQLCIRRPQQQDEVNLEQNRKGPEYQYRSLVENSSDMVIRYDRDCRRIYINPAFERLLQTDSHDLIGKTPTEVAVLLEPDAYEQSIRQVFESGEPLELDVESRQPNGNIVWGHVRFCPEFDDSGEIATVLALGRDITMRKQHEAVLQQHSELSRRLTHFAATAPGFMFTCQWLGENGLAFQYASPGVEDICGLKPEQVVSDADAFLVKMLTDDCSRFCQEIKKSAEKLSLLACDFRILHPVKGLIWVEVRATPQRESDGHTLWYGFMTDITERKLTEEKLWASEQSLRAIVDYSPDILVRYDHEFRRVYVSRSYSDTHGIAVEEILGKRPSDFWLSSNMTAAEFEQALQQVMETGCPSDIEFDWVKSPDEITYHWMRAVPECDREGNVISVLALARDITAMKRTEAELAAREQEFRTLIEHIPDNLVRYDRDMRIRYINPVLAKTMGIAQEDWIGKYPYEVVDMTIFREYVAVLEQVIKTGEPADYLLVATPENWGRDIYDNIRFAPEFSSDGTVVGAIAIGRDLSTQRKLELEVALREQEFRTLAQNSPDMIVRYDRDCKRVYINPAYEYYTGIPRENAINQSPAQAWTSLMPSDEYCTRLQCVMQTGQADQMLLEWKMQDGTIASHLMHAVAEYDEGGKVIGALVIGHNITDLKATERRLEESRAQLQLLTYHREEAREEERRRVAREIHDELGQLLSVLRLGISTLDYRYGEANPDLHNKAVKMSNVVDQAIDMIHTLATRLRPAVIESGITLAVEWLVQEFGKSTGIKCEFHPPKGEISLDKDDALALFRIVQESMTNILRHAEADHVEIALSQQGQELMLQIRDNGKGFVPESIGKHGSFGIIGMQERVLMMGGRLDIDSAPSVGTVLQISVPMRSELEKAEI